MKKDKTDKETVIIEELTLQLQRQLQNNQKLKNSLEEAKNKGLEPLKQVSPVQVKAFGVSDESAKLRRVNSKLKRYASTLEEQMRAVSGVDNCQAHKNWLDTVIAERNYYLEMATNSSA